MCKVKCQWKTCINFKGGECYADSIELKTFDYEEEKEEREGLNCGSYKYDSIWMIPKGREVDLKA